MFLYLLRNTQTTTTYIRTHETFKGILQTSLNEEAETTDNIIDTQLNKSLDIVKQDLKTADIKVTPEGKFYEKEQNKEYMLLNKEYMLLNKEYMLLNKEHMLLNKEHMLLSPTRGVRFANNTKIAKKLLKWITNPKMIDKNFTWQSRVLHRLAYFICCHISSNKTKTYDWGEYKAVIGNTFKEEDLYKIINMLSDFGMADWGNSENILPITTGLAFMDLIPENAKPTEEQLRSTEMLEISFIPQFSGELPQNFDDTLLVVKQHHSDSFYQLKEIPMFVEPIVGANWDAPFLRAATWERFYKTLQEFFNKNPLPSAMNNILGSRVQTAFDLTCLLTTEDSDKRGHQFFEKRMQVQEVFATNYTWIANNPGRWGVTGTNYLTFRADFRQTILRAAELEKFLPGYMFTSVDITGCHLGVALGMIGPMKAPVLWNIFEQGLNQWDEGKKYFPPGVPYYKRHLKSAFYALLNGGSGTYEGIKRHITKAIEGQGLIMDETEINQIVNIVAKHPFIVELTCFQEMIKNQKGGMYVPISTRRVFRSVVKEEQGQKIESEASYKYASPIFCAWESMFIAKVTLELMKFCSEGFPLYIVGNMHDGVLILHKKSLDLSLIQHKLNQKLGKYSKESIGLALRVTIKGEAE